MESCFNFSFRAHRLTAVGIDGPEMVAGFRVREADVERCGVEQRALRAEAEGADPRGRRMTQQMVHQQRRDVRPLHDEAGKLRGFSKITRDLTERTALITIAPGTAAGLHKVVRDAIKGEPLRSRCGFSAC